MVHAVDVCTGVVPGTEHGFDRLEQLFLGVVGEIFAKLFFILCLELVCKSFKVVRVKLYVKLNALLCLHFVDKLFEIFFTDFHNDVGEHLYETPVTVPSPTGIAGFCGYGIYNVLVQTEV